MSDFDFNFDGEVLDPEHPTLEHLVAVKAVTEGNELCVQLLYLYPIEDTLYFGEIEQETEFKTLKIPQECTVAEWAVVTDESSDGDDGENIGVIHHIHVPKRVASHFLIELGEIGN